MENILVQWQINLFKTLCLLRTSYWETRYIAFFMETGHDFKYRINFNRDMICYENIWKNYLFLTMLHLSSSPHPLFSRLTPKLYLAWEFRKSVKGLYAHNTSNITPQKETIINTHKELSCRYSEGNWSSIYQLDVIEENFVNIY